MPHMRCTPPVSVTIFSSIATRHRPPEVEVTSASAQGCGAGLLWQLGEHD